MDAAHSLDQLAAIPDLQAAATAGAKAIGDVPRLEAARDLLTSQLAAARDRPTRHTVQPGDNLTRIADRYGLVWQTLQEWNGLPSTTIRPGQVLNLFAPSTTPIPVPTPVPTPATTTFGLDLGDLAGTPDEPIPEARKLADHRAMLGGGLQHVRVFLQTRALGPDLWASDQRLAALRPGDSCHVTTNLPIRQHQAAFRKMLDATPDHLRGRVLWGVRHEMEADLTTDTAVRGWLDDNQAMADTLDAADGYSPDGLVKTLLFFSQYADPQLKGSWPRFHGGQDFGMIGMDCYHLQARLNDVQNGKPAGTYTPPEILFGILVEIAKQTGRPVCAPEWGGTRANTDPTGEGRAKAIRDGGAFMRAHGIRHAAWWCAYGRSLNGVRLNHHLDVDGPNSPEVAAYKALIAA